MAQDGIILSDILDKIMAGHCFKEDYNKNTIAFCYDNVSYEDAIEKLDEVRKFLKINHM